MRMVDKRWRGESGLPSAMERGAGQNVVDRECKMRLTRLAAFVLLAMVFVSTSARAAVINYGNFGPIPPGITFLGVQESSGTDAVPLYGPPSPTPIGLDFDPVSFLAFGSGGNTDITDGQLNFAVKTTTTPISEISLFEGGDYSLSGIAGPPNQASVFAGLSMRLTITEIDNNAVAPINVPVSTANFSANSPPNQFGPWNLRVDRILDAAIAAFPHTIGVTKVEVAIDNDLTAISQTNSAALIAKKEFQVAVNTDISRIVPEPRMLTLAGIAMFGLFGRRRASV